MEKSSEAFKTDEFHYQIIRNPILLIIKNWLLFARPNNNIFSRIVKILDQILLCDSTRRIKTNERVSIRGAIFYGIYLISEWKIGSECW